MIKKYSLLALFMVGLLISCGDDKQSHSQNDSNKTDDKYKSIANERVIDRTNARIKNDIELSDPLKARGLELGKVRIMTSDTAATDHILRAYLIFEKDFMDELRISVTDKNGLEYGRLNKSIERKAGDAGFIEFVFTSKTDIEDESHILIEAF
jgi:hypothetical protein